MSEPRQQLMEMGCAIKRTPDELYNNWPVTTSGSHVTTFPKGRQLPVIPRNCYE